LEYYFENKELVPFLSELDPRKPLYLEAMQGFIRPEEVVKRLSEIDINKNYSQLENMEKIFDSTYMNWVSDWARFKQKEYWQTPSDFILNKGGDCEDWAIYTLSLLRAYDTNLNCYAALWSTHVNVICQLNQTFIILDQDKIRSNLVLDSEWSFQENEIQVRTWKNNYLDSFGFSGELFGLFNEKEFIEFENNQDFIDWVLEKGEIK